ncbi:hypothetical protein [Bordetella hinzii]|uniref:Toxin n=3 Tax=Bordetella hinzii TaxID=103855 RepID=A0AAN1RXD9_9BORD|nr:hypothetical protein [Bordetella hinzii]AKQ56794.1 hypothetical protein ACR54_03499 [Bordetella hinzii]AKQ61261.1 hypothetical protein ACR55_03412 [Bordetella hinzii]AZW17749.1 toxin [Bordetella hinzii]KCB21985.1 hypothetical protein L544_2354 [Bordetella hinzii OH87 BAL007II]KCB30368.1 hypothetical protein L541_2650 [Bordetella hinzii CA90 BAL1384]
MRPFYHPACRLALVLLAAMPAAGPARAFSFMQQGGMIGQVPPWAQDLMSGVRTEYRDPAGPRRKLDAQGIGFYSDVRTLALERRADIVCALFGRGQELVVAGCAPAREASRLADSLIENRPLKVYLDHTKRYAPVQTQEAFRITRIQP